MRSQSIVGVTPAYYASTDLTAAIDSEPVFAVTLNAYATIISEGAASARVLAFDCWHAIVRRLKGCQLKSSFKVECYVI